MPIQEIRYRSNWYWFCWYPWRRWKCSQKCFSNCWTYLRRYWCQSLHLPVLPLWRLQRAKMQQRTVGSWCFGCWLWNHGRKRLLDCQE